VNFLDPKVFQFLKTIQDGFSTILDEYNTVQTKGVPWPELFIYNKGWDVIGLKYQGKHREFRDMFPKTCEIFDSVKTPGIPTYGFSIMRPGCEIKPHKGYTELQGPVLRGHLCLTTNPDSRLVVNDEERNWEVGEFLIFDDLNLHAAYNRGTTDRVVVLFDFSRYYKNKNF
jgi:beta-hydroxylase